MSALFLAPNGRSPSAIVTLGTATLLTTVRGARWVMAAPAGRTTPSLGITGKRHSVQIVSVHGLSQLELGKGVALFPGLSAHLVAT